MSTAITVSSKIFERYSHYPELRTYGELLSGGKTRWMIQGWNGKKWVCAKARKGASRRPKKGSIS